MARSVRLSPVTGNARHATSEKDDKRVWNRRLRHLNRVRLLHGQDPVTLREVSEVWTGAKDGKRRFDPTMFPHLLRK